MDGSSLKRNSGLTPAKYKEKPLQENLWRKLKFLRSFKNYIISKFRSGKYEVTGRDDAVSMISYEQRSFNDVEKEFDLQPFQSITIDPKIIETLRKALDQQINDCQRQEKLEILEVIEKTFSRQLDIFQELLKCRNSDNYNGSVDYQNKQINSNQETNFVKALLSNIITELTNSSMDNLSLPKTIDYRKNPETEEISTEENFGDNSRVKMKKRDVKCECQEVNASGAAVPNVSPTNNS